MANSYLNRTQSSGNRRTFTISTWFKRATLGSSQELLGFAKSGNLNMEFKFLSSDVLRFYSYNGSSTTANFTTNKVFRDTSAWYHFVLSIDTTQSTEANRMKFYVNGVQETSFSTITYPTLNEDLQINHGEAIAIGAFPVPPDYFDGYMSHVALVDGQALAPTVFGETDSTSGIWKFKSPSGVTWGTNGFHLKFENSGNLGLDSSGQTNNFTVNGNLKQSISTPSNVLTSLNNLSNAMAGDYTIANTTVQSQSASNTSAPAYANYGVNKGKWYWEVKCAAINTGSWTYSLIGITALLRSSNAQYNHLGNKPEDYGYYSYNGHIMNNAGSGNTGTAYGNTYTLNDIIGVALDLDNNKLYFHKNGTYQDSGVPTSGSTGTGAVSITDPDGLGDGVYYPAVGDYHYNPRYTFQMNFGEGRFGTTAITSAGSNGNGSLFEYDVPTGYYALNTKNLNTYG